MVFLFSQLQQLTQYFCNNHFLYFLGFIITIKPHCEKFVSFLFPFQWICIFVGLYLYVRWSVWSTQSETFRSLQNIVKSKRQTKMGEHILAYILLRKGICISMLSSKGYIIFSHFLFLLILNFFLVCFASNANKIILLSSWKV